MRRGRTSRADPIVAAAAIISALQSIVSRRLNPATPGVVTIGSIHAGSASNVIPERATLTGTVRAVEPQSRELMLNEVRQVTESVAAAFGVQARVTLDLGTPPIVNPAGPVAWARQASATTVGAENVVPLGFLNMAGEDFAHYMESIPGCFMRIGAREPGAAVIPAHARDVLSRPNRAFSWGRRCSLNALVWLLTLLPADR